MEYAIVEFGGKQYIMRPGQLVRLEKINQAEGSSVEFRAVYLVRTDAGTEVAANHEPLPYIVRGTIVRHERAKKIIVFKKRRKEQYKKKQGHRQWMTLVRIEEIRPAEKE